MTGKEKENKKTREVLGKGKLATAKQVHQRSQVQNEKRDNTTTKNLRFCCTMADIILKFND